MKHTPIIMFDAWLQRRSLVEGGAFWGSECQENVFPGRLLNPLKPKIFNL